MAVKGLSLGVVNAANVLLKSRVVSKHNTKEETQGRGELGGWGGGGREVAGVCVYYLRPRSARSVHRSVLSTRGGGARPIR